ncbi:MAG: hypothetical protein Q8R07_00055 [Candidatus Uhrbacteria bacterium]|nr:hypothetical protein [Candidatus Uhrbacteria bacterium]
MKITTAASKRNWNSGRTATHTAIIIRSGSPGLTALAIMRVMNPRSARVPKNHAGRVKTRWNSCPQFMFDLLGHVFDRAVKESSFDDPRLCKN